MTKSSAVAKKASETISVRPPGCVATRYIALTLAYSKCGLTIALNNKTKVLLSVCTKFLLMTPKTLYALLIFFLHVFPKI